MDGAFATLRGFAWILGLTSAVKYTIIRVRVRTGRDILSQRSSHSCANSYNGLIRPFHSET
eukprot:scaffold6144_cov142-Skeletonema_dohrnii-CCMP3373.AAC.7